jgi:6,7-dimethyl-8-ribityllumazine synthase
MSTGSGFFELVETNAYPTSQEAADLRIGVVAARWNHVVTEPLTTGCIHSLEARGIQPYNLILRHVPGCFEIPTGCQWLDRYENVDALIALGCLIKGETPHFEHISDAVTHGLMNLMVSLNKPIVNGILTVHTLDQATDRLGGAHGHKGREAAETVLLMLRLKSDLMKS